MRVATVNEIKRNKPFDKYQKPKEGGGLRHWYDLFMENKAVPIAVSLAANSAQHKLGKVYLNSAYLEQLRSRYGLDIRRVSTKSWMLVGEWDGRVYIDYVAEKVLKDEPADEAAAAAPRPSGFNPEVKGVV